VRIPATTVSLDPSEAEQVRTLVEAIEDHDDVDAVYTTLADDGEALSLHSDD
jgi:transcriptional/translational regulatory protein YebC/TACO1